jgi:hypothetical protein
LVESVTQLCLDLLDMHDGEELIVFNETVTKVLPLLPRQSWNAANVLLADPLWALGVPSDVGGDAVKALGTVPEEFAAAAQRGLERPRKVLCNAFQDNLSGSEYAFQLQRLINAGVSGARNARSWRQLIDCLSASVIMGEGGRAVVVVPEEALGTEWLELARKELICEKLLEKVIYLRYPTQRRCGSAAVLVLSCDSGTTRFYVPNGVNCSLDKRYSVDLLREADAAVAAADADLSVPSNDSRAARMENPIIPSLAPKGAVVYKRLELDGAHKLVYCQAWDMSQSELLNAQGCRLDLASAPLRYDKARYPNAARLGDIASVAIGVKPETVKLYEDANSIPSNELAVGVHAKDLLYGEYETDSPTYIDKETLGEGCLELEPGDILIPRTSQGVGAMTFRQTSLNHDCYVAFSDLIVVRPDPTAFAFNSTGTEWLAAFLNSDAGLRLVTNGVASKRISTKALRELRVPADNAWTCRYLRHVGGKFAEATANIRDLRRSLSEQESILQDAYKEAAFLLNRFKSE